MSYQGFAKGAFEDIPKAKDKKLPATAENIQAAKDFLFKKWTEYRISNGDPAPVDLSSACKVGSLFASRIFGGKIKGHEFHQWVVLSDSSKTIIDLSDDAKDVAELKQGIIPDYCLEYAKEYEIAPPPSLYTHDPVFIKSPGHESAMESWKYRVGDWVGEFIQQVTGINPDNPQIVRIGAIDGLSLYRRNTWYCLTNDDRVPEIIDDSNVVYYVSVCDEEIWSEIRPVPDQYKQQIDTLKRHLKVLDRNGHQSRADTRNRPRP